MASVDCGVAALVGCGVTISVMASVDCGVATLVGCGVTASVMASVDLSVGNGVSVGDVQLALLPAPNINLNLLLKWLNYYALTYPV